MLLASLRHPCGDNRWLSLDAGGSPAWRRGALSPYRRALVLQATLRIDFCIKGAATERHRAAPPGASPTFQAPRAFRQDTRVRRRSPRGSPRARFNTRSAMSTFTPSFARPVRPVRRRSCAVKAAMPCFLNRLRHRATLRVMYFGSAGADLSAFGSTKRDPPAMNLSFCSSATARPERGKHVAFPSLGVLIGDRPRFPVKSNSRHSASASSLRRCRVRRRTLARAADAGSGTRHPDS